MMVNHYFQLKSYEICTLCSQKNQFDPSGTKKQKGADKCPGGICSEDGPISLHNGHRV